MEPTTAGAPGGAAARRSPRRWAGGERRPATHEQALEAKPEPGVLGIEVVLLGGVRGHDPGRPDAQRLGGPDDRTLAVGGADDHRPVRGEVRAAILDDGPGHGREGEGG